mgnify:CR=1 FL=1
MSKSNKCCLLCDTKPENGFHLTGKKFLNSKAMSYQLCKKCCLEVDSKSLDTPMSRKNVWAKVEKKLLEQFK